MTANGTNFTGFKAPDALAADVIYTLPIGDATASGDVLTSNAAGVLSWTTSAGEATTASNGLTLTGSDVTLGGSLTSNTTITQGANLLSFTSTVVNGFSVDGTTFSVDALNNRVGIGTGTPSVALDVQTPTHGVVNLEGPGGSIMSYQLKNGQGTYRFKSNGGSDRLDIESTTGVGGLVYFYGATGNIALAPISGNVGIGTLSPAAHLHIAPTSPASILVDPYGTAAGNTGEFQLRELTANGTNFTGFKAPDALGLNTIYTLPVAYPATAGDVLASDVAGVLSWKTLGTIVCPAGFTAYNTKYCIEDNERAAGTFWTASSTCIGIEGRLCSLSEWYTACQDVGFASMANKTDDYEWVEFGGLNSGTVVGSGSCTTTSTDSFTNNYVFRCCFSR